MQQLFEVPYIKVNPRSTIQYQLLEDGNGNCFRKNIDPLQEEKNLRNNTTQGYLSKKAKKRLADCVDWINELTDWKKMNIDGMTVKYKLTFMTLTLPSPQVNDLLWNRVQKIVKYEEANNIPSVKNTLNYIDDIIKRDALNQFLTELRDQHGMKLYIWRAEAQKNGNIHFHIITDVGIHYATVRRIWNRCLEKLGYISAYADSHKNLSLSEYRLKYPDQKKVKGKHETIEEYNTRTFVAFNKGNREHWQCPNSTDIHSVKRVRDLRKYVTKYLCKEVDNFTDRLITGRLWFISQALSEARNMSDMVSTDIDEEIDKLSKNCGDRTFKSEHCFILQLSIKEIQKLGGVLIPEIFYEKLNYLKRKAYGNEQTQI